MRHQKCFALKEGLNQLLDVHRANYNGAVDAMKEHCRSLEEDFDVPLTLTHTVARGFHFEIARVAKNEVRNDYTEALKLYCFRHITLPTKQASFNVIFGQRHRRNR